MDMNQMMQQAQQMQLELARAQEEIKGMTYTATSGGGMVSATALGDGSVQSIEIDPEVVDPDDVETLSDILVAAVNEAIKKVNETNSDEMGKITGSLGMPGIPGLF